MKKNIYFLTLLFLIVSGVSAQTTQQIVVGNGGIYNNTSDHVTITGINPDDYSSSTIGEVIKESIQDLIVVGNVAFVAAEDSLVKIDLQTNSKLATIYQPNLSRLYSSEDVLYVSLRSDLNGPPADGVYLRAFDLELNELYETSQISSDAAGICRINDTIYVAISGDWQATEGHIAILSADFSYFREENWGSNAVGIYDLIPNGNMIYTINKSPYGASTGSISVYNALTAEQSTYVLQNIVGKGVALLGNTLFLGLDYGIGSFNINTHQVLNNQIVPDPGSASYINIAAAVLDPVSEKFYVTITDYFSMGQGIVYDIDGNMLSNFDAMVSAEAMAIHYDLGSAIPELTNNSVTVYPNPFTNHLHINSDSEISEINIYNLSGQLVSSLVPNQSNTYELKHLISGTYLLKIKNSKGLNIQKLLKH